MAIFNSKLLVYQRVNDSAIFDANMVFWLIKFGGPQPEYVYIYIIINIYIYIYVYII